MIFYIAGTRGNGAVYRWNPATPTTTPTLLGRTGSGTPYMPKLAFSANGTLYAIDTDVTRLYTIDQITGTALATGSALTGIPAPSGGGDIAFHPTTGVLYLIDGTTLYTVPLAGGALTNLGSITGIAGTVGGLAFDPASG